MQPSQSDYIQTNDAAAFIAAQEGNTMSDIITTRDAGNIELAVGKIAQAQEANGWHERFHELTLAGDDEGLREHVIVKATLAMGEVSEAIEELRDGHGIREVYHSEGGKPEGFPIEIADAVIRLFDLAGLAGIDLGKAMREKLRYNASRGHKHGGKTI